MPRLPSSALLAGIAALCLAAVGLALVSQHRFDMQPCPWCVLQRLIYLVIAAVALLALLVRARAWRTGAVVMLLALCGAGIAAALWQHFVAASQSTCDFTLAERIVGWTGLDERFPDVFVAWASCKDAAVKLLGVSYELWSLALYALLALAAAFSLRRH